MATLLLFGPARSAAGTSRLSIDAATLEALLDIARARFGPSFAEVVAGSAVWVNGEPAGCGVALAFEDEVAVIPPVSGGT
jgi:molybdopterin converting factor small subunit